MRNIVLLIFVGVFAFQSYETCAQDKSGWVLKFEDNFDDDALDEKVWQIAKGVTRDKEFKHEKQWYSKNNIELKDGFMYMIAKREEVTGEVIVTWEPLVKKEATLNFTSADINTHKHYHYGIYEIRCKIPKGKGFFPAFWMWGAGENGNSNEIDVFEFWNEQTWLKKYSKKKESRVVHMTTHMNGRMSHKYKKGIDYSEEYHVFTVIWDEEKIEWYIDGNRKRVYKKSKRNDVFPIYPMQIRVDLAIKPGKDAPDSSVVLPQALEVDYIRHWVKK